MALRVAIIDHYDSYTHNLAHLFASPRPPTVIPADSYPSLVALEAMHSPFDAYILSPGPGTPTNPQDFPPLSRQILASSKPVLGVCLGHQALCAARGAAVTLCPSGPAHGAVTRVNRIADCPLLDSLPVSFRVVRYHSLSVSQQAATAAALCVTAVADTTAGSVAMAVRDPRRPHFGVQFHPESVASEHGAGIAANFLAIAASQRAQLAPVPPVPPVPSADSVPSTLCQRTSAKQCASLYATRIRRRTRCRGKTASDPAIVFQRLFSGPAFWLDSAPSHPISRCSSPGVEDDTLPAAGPAHARFSIMGAADGPLAEVVSYDVARRCVRVEATGGERLVSASIFDYLRDQLAERYVPPHPNLPVEMNGGYVGFFGYEAKADVYGVHRNVHDSNLPDAWFIFADRLIVFDHQSTEIFLVAVVRKETTADDSAAERWFDAVAEMLDSQPDTDSFDQVDRNVGSQPPLVFTPERCKRAYLDDIEECLREIRRGESYEICLTNRLRTRITGTQNKLDPFDFYCALRVVNPAPYSAFLQLNDDLAVCCSSPERYLRISSTGEVESKPIKGTVPRGRSQDEDAHLRLKLQASEKDRRENLMIVDLVRNDLSRSCKVGSVKVPKLMHVESYATVHQLVSTVVGKLSNPRNAIDCIRAAYPMGSMTGAPKVRTMEIIDRLEKSARGIYSGSIGYMSLCGAADMNVVIRTAVLTGDEVEIGVGGAIVAMSNPQEEYEEVILKGRAIMQSLAMNVTGRHNYIVAHEGHARSKFC